jgi:hypothetical protein
VEKGFEIELSERWENSARSERLGRPEKERGRQSAEKDRADEIGD